MKDYRNKKSALKSITRLAGMDVNEYTVKGILTTMGVNPTQDIVSEAIGYLSSNSMEFTMGNLYQFFKTKQIMSKKDMRKKKLGSNKILTINIPIINSQNFNNNMYEKGYTDFTQDFLIKKFENVTVNITRNNKEIAALTGYDEDQNMVNIPNDIFELVKQDINECNI